MSSPPTQQLASPRSSEQAAEILRQATNQGLAIEITGAGTNRDWGNPVTASLLLSTTQLTGLRDHSWQDLTATVAAGTPWSVLQRALSLHGQRVALDPLWPDKATVGGIVATNDSGSLRTRHGSLRDLIIGMTIVLADGTVARSGGKVVKNVAGYDLHKLMIGAFGTLGLITEVTFRLHPLAQSSATWTVTSTDISALDRLRHQLGDSTMSIEAMQFRTGSEGYSLDVKFVTVAEALEDHGLRLQKLAEPLGVTSGNKTDWFTRERLFETGDAVVKIAMSATDIAILIADIQASGGSCVTQQSGVMTASLQPDRAKISELRAKIMGLGGSLTVLCWPQGVSLPPERWGTAGSTLPLMREIKRQFDPKRIINPGRFLGGI